MKTKHLIISRVALYWNHKNLKTSWEEYILDRIMLYNSLTRPSVANQSCQDFVLMSLVDEQVSLSDDLFDNAMLPNEVQVRVPRGNMHVQIPLAVTKWLTEQPEYCDRVIVTRLDSDDLLHRDFIANVQDMLIQ